MNRSKLYSPSSELACASAPEQAPIFGRFEETPDTAQQPLRRSHRLQNKRTVARPHDHPWTMWTTDSDIHLRRLLDHCFVSSNVTYLECVAQIMHQVFFHFEKL